jgi:hypothetical protein
MLHRPKSTTPETVVQAKSFLAADLVNMSVVDLEIWLKVRRANGALDRDVLGMARDLAVKCRKPNHLRLFEMDLRKMAWDLKRRTLRNGKSV